MPEKQLSIQALDKDPSPVYGGLEQTLTYMLRIQDTDFFRNEEEFQWTQKDFMTYRIEAVYWQKRELIGSMLSFLTIGFAQYLCLCYRKIIYTALIPLDEIPQVYRTDAIQPSSTLEQHTFTLFPLPSIKDEHKSIGKSIMSLTTPLIFSVLQS